MSTPRHRRSFTFAHPSPSPKASVPSPRTSQHVALLRKSVLGSNSSTPKASTTTTTPKHRRSNSLASLTKRITPRHGRGRLTSVGSEADMESDGHDEFGLDDDYFSAYDYDRLIALCKLGKQEAVLSVVGSQPVAKRQEFVNKHDHDKNSPLYHAVLSRSQGLVEMLLDYGADVNGFNIDGNTCLHIAAMHGLHGIITQLLEAGADVSKANQQSDRSYNMSGVRKRTRQFIIDSWNALEASKPKPNLKRMISANAAKSKQPKKGPMSPVHQFDPHYDALRHVELFAARRAKMAVVEKQLTQRLFELQTMNGRLQNDTRGKVKYQPPKGRKTATSHAASARAMAKAKESGLPWLPTLHERPTAAHTMPPVADVASLAEWTKETLAERAQAETRNPGSYVDVKTQDWETRKKDLKARDQRLQKSIRAERLKAQRKKFDVRRLNGEDDRYVEIFTTLTDRDLPVETVLYTDEAHVMQKLAQAHAELIKLPPKKKKKNKPKKRLSVTTTDLSRTIEKEPSPTDLAYTAPTPARTEYHEEEEEEEDNDDVRPLSPHLFSLVGEKPSSVEHKVGRPMPPQADGPQSPLYVQALSYELGRSQMSAADYGEKGETQVVTDALAEAKATKDVKRQAFQAEQKAKYNPLALVPTTRLSQTAFAKKHTVPLRKPSLRYHGTSNALKHVAFAGIDYRRAIPASLTLAVSTPAARLRLAKQTSQYY